MSFLGKIGHLIAAPVKGAAHLVTDPGKAISNIGKSVAPIYHGAAVGAGGLGGFLLGGPTGAIAGAKVGDKIGNIGQDLLSGGSVRDHLTDNLVGAGEAAAGGYAASQLPGLISKIPGVGGASDAISTNLPPIYDEAGKLIPNPMNPASGAASGLGGLISKLGGGSGGIDLTKILQGLSGAEGVYNTIQSNKYRGKALDLANNQNAAAAPIRQAALEKLLHPQTPDLSSVYQNPQNPFSSRYRAVGM